MEFKTVEELKIRVMPALRVRRRELKRQNIQISEEELWDYFVENYFKKSYQLSLSKVVDIILNEPITLTKKEEMIL